MPLRAYEPLQSPCRLCGTGFELLQSGKNPELAECPRCGQPVRPKPAALVNTPKVTKPTSTSDAKSAGFTVLKRVGRGEYEKQ